MPVDGQEVELRGVLDSLSSRFYSGGWGFGTILTEHGAVKITGTLEGHVVGTSIAIRGTYKTTAYGQQVDCSSIVVDAVGGEIHVIRAWARKYCQELETEVVRVCRVQKPEDRWAVLTNVEQLQAAGFSEEQARVVALNAKTYLLIIEMKRELMQRGFSDREAQKMLDAYGPEDVFVILEEDPFGIVIDRVLPFSRIDAVAANVPRGDRRRLHAAQVQTLVGQMRNGHTALRPRAVMKEAAEIAGVYPDKIQAVGYPREIVDRGDFWQLASTAEVEEQVADWLAFAMKLEVEG